MYFFSYNIIRQREYIILSIHKIYSSILKNSKMENLTMYTSFPYMQKVQKMSLY
jgi:hypothetical protein